MLSIIEAAGWPIWFIIITSVIALAIIGERFWSLRTSLVAPRDVLPATIREYQAKGVTQDLINRLQRGPLIGRIFAAALVNEQQPARGDQGRGRGRGARRGPRARALPQHAGHDRHDLHAARPLRHDRRHDRDLRLAEPDDRAATPRSSRTASRSRSTTRSSASAWRSRR